MTQLPTSFAELLLLREGVDVEVKKAQGQNRPEELPTVQGLEEDKRALLVNVRRVSRQERPVYVGQHLLVGVRPDTVSLKLTMQSLRPEISIEALHSTDITRLLGNLADRRMLQPEGQGRWTKYRLSDAGSTGVGAQQNLWQMADPVQQGQAPMQQDGILMPQGQATEPAKAATALGKRASREAVQEAILLACSTDYRTLVELAEQRGRSPETLRSHYLPDMVTGGQLLLLYPETPTRKGQAYRTALSPQEPS